MKVQTKEIVLFSLLFGFIACAIGLPTGGDDNTALAVRDVQNNLELHKRGAPPPAVGLVFGIIGTRAAALCAFTVCGPKIAVLASVVGIISGVEASAASLLAYVRPGVARPSSARTPHLQITSITFDPNRNLTFHSGFLNFTEIGALVSFEGHFDHSERKTDLVLFEGVGLARRDDQPAIRFSAAAVPNESSCGQASQGEDQAAAANVRNAMVSSGSSTFCLAGDYSGCSGSYGPAVVGYYSQVVSYNLNFGCPSSYKQYNDVYGQVSTDGCDVLDAKVNSVRLAAQAVQSQSSGADVLVPFGDFSDGVTPQTNCKICTCSGCTCGKNGCLC
ncbi:hypothetical protein DFJ73DRAFT_801049 [Zopfochytrium polystomum]|nr:hypothetical protein DFJ73DRAFT_801049 [Zopfochytrium polystomum]